MRRTALTRRVRPTRAVDSAQKIGFVATVSQFIFPNPVSAFIGNSAAISEGILTGNPASMSGSLAGNFAEWGMKKIGFPEPVAARAGAATDLFVSKVRDMLP